MNDTVNHFSDPWTITRKCSFRFAFIFILTFVIVNNNGTFLLFTTITEPLTGMLYSFVPWFSQHILQYHYDYKIVTNGSGDTSFNWVLLFIIFVASFVGTIVWSFLDRKRKSYNTCYYWLTVSIRYYVGFMLINYGAIKLAHAQMLPPTLHRLMEPLGEFSPMGLAWTFFGFSKAYNLFIGIIEILSAFLLFRQTMVLGALITIATSLNIMAVNYFFDVPVKLVSTALFLLALYLLLPYLSSLYSLFIKGEKAQLATIERPVY